MPDSRDSCPLQPGDLPNGCPSSPGTTEADRDDDGVANEDDDCASVPGDLANGCPSRLDADVRGHWRVNKVYSQLVTLSVRSTIGSRIELRCSRSGCGFTKRTIASTKTPLTNLARYFKGKRILPPNLSITVRVTRPGQVGTYERLQTRSGRQLPKVTKRCLSALSSAVGICSDCLDPAEAEPAQDAGTCATRARRRAVRPRRRPSRPASNAAGRGPPR